MTKTIGVIGLGSIGLRHAKNLRDLGCNVRARDPNMERRLMFDGVLWEMDEVLASDAVVIASPTNTHWEHLCALANTGKPIFMEKPIADTPNAGLAFDRITQYPFMVGYNLRFHSCVKKCKEWLDAGMIGESLWANFTVAQYNDKPAYLRDGVILNWSHEIDLALYLLGPATVAASSTRLTDGRDDVTDILLTHGSECRSSVHLDYLTRPEIRQDIIVGSDGAIIIDLVSRNAWLRNGFGTILDHHKGQDSFDENYIEEMQAFIDRIDGKETIGCTGEESLAVLGICLRVREQAGIK